jgi:hypothetical protein
MDIEKGRLGQFFLFIGLLFLAVFFTTDQSQDPQTWLFFAGVASIGLGIYFIRRDWKPPPPSQRFRMLRKKKKQEGEGEGKK